MITNSIVTLFCFSKADGKYVNAGCFPAWVHRRHKLKSDKSGVQRNDAFDVRIDSSKISEVCIGDMIFFGGTDSENPDLSVCRRVAAVSDNRFGGKPHWHLKAEFDYR